MDWCLIIMNKIFLILFVMIPAFSTANAELPDPTRPATYLVENIEPIYVEEYQPELQEKINWRLSAIRISESDRSAIVNGKLVREGDDVESGKILEINPLSVVIDHKKQKLIVRLFNTKVIKDYKSTK
jgi:hypothetical protein